MHVFSTWHLPGLACYPFGTASGHQWECIQWCLQAVAQLPELLDRNSKFVMTFCKYEWPKSKAKTHVCRAVFIPVCVYVCRVCACIVHMCVCIVCVCFLGVVAICIWQLWHFRGAADKLQAISDAASAEWRLLIGSLRRTSLPSPSPSLSLYPSPSACLYLPPSYALSLLKDCSVNAHINCSTDK